MMVGRGTILKLTDALSEGVTMCMGYTASWVFNIVVVVTRIARVRETQ
jgi:hypothetical protein